MEPLRAKASDFGFRGEFRAQGRRLMEAYFQGDRSQNDEMAEEFQGHWRGTECLSHQECRRGAEKGSPLLRDDRAQPMEYRCGTGWANPPRVEIPTFDGEGWISWVSKVERFF